MKQGCALGRLSPRDSLSLKRNKSGLSQNLQGLGFRVQRTFAESLQILAFWSAGKEVLAKKMETSVMGYIGTTIRLDPSFLANQIPVYPRLGTIQRLCLCLHAQKLQLNTDASSKHLAEGRGNNEQRF